MFVLCYEVLLFPCLSMNRARLSICVCLYIHTYTHMHAYVYFIYISIYIHIYISRKPLSHNIISNPNQNTIGFTHFLLFSEQPGPTYSFDQFLWMYPISHKLSPPILIWMPTSLRLGCQCCSVNRLPSSSCLDSDTIRQHTNPLPFFWAHICMEASKYLNMTRVQLAGKTRKVDFG